MTRKEKRNRIATFNYSDLWVVYIGIVVLMSTVGCSGNSENLDNGSTTQSSNNPKDPADPNARVAPKPYYKRTTHQFDPSQPVDYEKKWESMYEMNEDRRSFHALAIDHYRENNPDADNFKRKLIEFCTKVLENQWPDTENEPHDWEKLYTAAQPLLQDAILGKDPLLLLHASIVAHHVGSVDESTQLVVTAIDRFRPTNYPMRIIAFAHSWQQKVVEHGAYEFDTRHKTEPTTKAISDWLLTDFRAEPDQHYFVFEIIENHFDYCKELGADLNDFTQKFSNEQRVPPWIREMILARNYLNQAWMARGSGFANEVTQQGWRGFEAGLKRGAQHAENAFRINPNFAIAPTYQLEAALLGYNSNSVEECFDKVRESQFDFPPAYSRFKHFHQSKWGGSPDELLQHGVWCYETQRFDTFLPLELPRVLRQINVEYPKDVWKPIYADQELHEKVRDCLTRYAGLSPEPKKSFYLSLRALFTNRFGDQEQAYQDFLELEEEIDPVAMAWFGQNVGPSFLAGAWNMREQDLVTEYSELLSIFTEQGRTYRAEHAQEIRDLVKAGTQHNLDATGRALFAHYERWLDYELTFDRGEWVDLEFHPGLLDWHCTNFSTVTAKDPSTVLLDTLREDLIPHFYMMPFASFPGPKILEADFDVGSLVDEGAVFCPGIRISGEGCYVTASVTRQNGVMWIHEEGQRPEMVIVEGNWPAKQKLRMNVANGYVEVYVNDQIIMTYQSNSFGPGHIVSLAREDSFQGRGIASISNFRVMKWDVPEPPELHDPQDFDLDAVKEFYTALQKTFPEQPYYEYRLALASFNGQQFDDAAKHAHRAIELGYPPQDLKYFIGFNFDQQGDFASALQWYSKSKDEESLRAFLNRGAFQKTISPSVLADSYGAWLQATSSSETVEQTTPPILPIKHPVPWIQQKIQAADSAHRGSFGNAVRALERIIDDVPPEFRKEVEEQMEAYRSDRKWVRPEGEKPFYLKFKTPFLIPGFQNPRFRI